MKMLTMIIRPEKLSEVATALQQAGATGMTITEVRGRGFQKDAPQIYRGMVYQTDLIEKVKIETVVANDLLDDVLESAYAAARTGQIGDGKIFVTEVFNVVQVRTEEQGKAAIKGPVVKMRGLSE